MWLAFLLQHEKHFENAYKTLMKQLKECRVLALGRLFGNLKWKDMMEEVLKLLKIFLFERIV